MFHQSSLDDDDYIDAFLGEYEPLPIKSRLISAAREALFVLVAFLLVWAVLVMMGVTAAQGATCRNGVCNIKPQQAVVKHVAAVQQVQAVAYQPVYYAVAPHLQDRAVIRYEVKEAVREALAELQHQVPPCGESCPPPNHSSTAGGKSAAQPTAPPVFSQRQSVLSASCMKCHSGDDPKSGVNLDVELNDELRAKIARQVITGAMPPKSPLSNEAKSQLLIELFGSAE